jgi:hypothetical protein
MGQTILTIFYVVWLLAVLALLAAVWWDTRHYIRLMEQTMLQSRAVSAQAALKAADAAERLARVLTEKRGDVG